MATREERVIETFLYLADTLVKDFDVDELLHVLARRCVELLDVDAAGVMLAMRPGELRAVAATSRTMGQLEIFEVAAGEGPSYEAYAHGEPVAVRDLGAAQERWPQFTPRALDLGFAAGYGFPLRLRERTIGALNLFQQAGGSRLSVADVGLAQGFADATAISLVQAELVDQAEATVGQLEHALAGRVVTEQAKGILAERLGLSPEEAFERLRGQARDQQRKVRDVAHEVVNEGLDARLTGSD